MLRKREKGIRKAEGASGLAVRLRNQRCSPRCRPHRGSHPRPSPCRTAGPWWDCSRELESRSEKDHIATPPPQKALEKITTCLDTLMQLGIHIYSNDSPACVFVCVHFTDTVMTLGHGWKLYEFEFMIPCIKMSLHASLLCLCLSWLHDYLVVLVWSLLIGLPGGS